jgi:hypothetical protein
MPRRSAPARAQRKLIVGPAGDALEREADEVARQVLEGWPSGSMSRADEQLARSVSSAGGPAGGELDPDTEESVTAARDGGGRRLPAELRSRFEDAFAADFGAVRLHSGTEPARLNRALGARAFTVGHDVFLGGGHPALDSDSGVQLLAHELTHTLQQGSAVQRERVQRDIGFEFETKNVNTKRTNLGVALPAIAFADANAGAAAWNDPAATRVNKGDALLKGPVVAAGKPDIEVQADDSTAGSDLEVVITHVPENAAGRTRLNTAMTNLNTLIAAHDGMVNVGGGIVPANAINGTANFGNPMVDGMFGGRWSAATTSPQVTMGMRVGNVVDIVKDLHAAPGESAAEKTARDPGRRKMRRDKVGAPTEPRDLTPLDEAQTLVDGLALAQAAVAAQQHNDHNAPGGKEVEGILTLMFAYAISGANKTSFLKNHTPLMAKTDLATMWDTLPNNVKTYYGQQNKSGKTNLEKAIETRPGYANRIGDPLIQVRGGLAEDDQALGARQWYNRLTMRDWVRSICVTQTRSNWQAFREFWVGTQSRGVDKLQEGFFPGMPANQEVEGYSALGNRMDTDVTTPATNLPVFELRSASRPITYAQSRQWALDVFDYITSLNANPGGGYQHIV